MLYNGSTRYPHKNYKREYGERLVTIALLVFAVKNVSRVNTVCLAASDFADGESWGYRKFYELSKLVRTWEQLFGAIVSLVSSPDPSLSQGETVW